MNQLVVTFHRNLFFFSTHQQLSSSALGVSLSGNTVGTGPSIPLPRIHMARIRLPQTGMSQLMSSVDDSYVQLDMTGMTCMYNGGSYGGTGTSGTVYFSSNFGISMGAGQQQTTAAGSVNAIYLGYHDRIITSTHHDCLESAVFVGHVIELFSVFLSLCLPSCHHVIYVIPCV